VAGANLFANPAQAIDDKAFACMTMQYWLSQNAIEERDIFADMKEKCSLGEQYTLEISEFINTVESVGDGGGREFLVAVYGQDRAKLFEDVTRETFRVIEISNASLMKTMPIPNDATMK